MKNAPVRYLVAATLLTVCVGGVAQASLPFVEDNYAAAVAQARSKGVPIFIEAWAPW